MNLSLKALRNRHQLIALAFFTLVALIASWPLILHIADRIPGWFIADNYEYLWKMWWFKHAIADVHQNPLFAPHIFYPQGFPLAHAELSPLHTVIGLPITLLLGEIPSYNLFGLLTFVLSGWATYNLVFRWTKNFWAGLLAGVIFILSPYHMVRYGGILPAAAIQGIPVFFLGIDAWVHSRRYRWIGVAGLGFLLAAWAYVYYAAGLLMLAPIYVLARAKSLPSLFKDRKTWIGLLLLVFVLFLILVPLALPYLDLMRQADLRISLDEVDFWSASPTDYLVPPGLHPLWGSWVRERLLLVSSEYPQIALEFVLGIGFLTLLLAIYGWRNARGPHRRAVAVLTLTAFVLSLGPRLHFGRHPIVIPASDAVADGFNRTMDQIGLWLPSHESYSPLAADDGLSIPLPALLLRWLLPPLKGMRAWNRFAVFAGFGLALLAGLGYHAWSPQLAGSIDRKPRRLSRRRAAGMLIIALAIFELWPGSIPLQPVEPRPVDLWLAEQPGEFSIMQLPLTSALSAPQMLYTRYHGKRTTFAYGTYFPYWYREQFPQLERCPEPACLELLRDWDVRYVLLNLSDKPNGPILEQQLDQVDGLRRVTQLQNIVIYQLLE
jgi:hypothetical protein